MDRTDIDPPRSRYVIGCLVGTLRPQNGRLSFARQGTHGHPPGCRAWCEGRRVVLSDVGGYFAPALSELCTALPGRMAGVIEDTENGHRRYKALLELPCAVYMVARSPLKEPEDRLAGEAIVFSAETLLRRLGEVLHGRQACVVGYGKVGAGIASTPRAWNVRVLVVDSDPVRQAQAIAAGYGFAELTEALWYADAHYAPGFYDVPPSRRAAIAAAWVDIFGSRPGRYL